MSRIGLAFSCFFKLLFGGRLPVGAAKFLPSGSEPVALNVPVAATAQPPVAQVRQDKEPAKAKVSAAAHHREGALAVLAILQREGRLIDFLREPLDGFSDADIGAAARDVHRGCRKAVDQLVTLEPVMPGNEEDRVAVPKGFDPSEIRLIGEAKGEAPFRGTLRHHGWRATDTRLPVLTDGVDRAVIAPAEVEMT